MKKFQVKIHWFNQPVTYGMIRIKTGECCDTFEDILSTEALEYGYINTLNKIQVDGIIEYFDKRWAGYYYDRVSKHEVVEVSSEK